MPTSPPTTSFLGLTEADFRLLDRHREILAQDTDLLAKRFYDYLLRYPATAAVFRDFSQERMEHLIQAQAAHARDLLASHLDHQWLHAMAEIGAHHYSLGVEPSWVTGAYAVYWDHWDHTMAHMDMDPAERSDLRRILFRLLLGDLMAQIDGYSTSARETDAERTAIFDVLLQTLTDHQAMEDLSGFRLLGGICSGLVRKNAHVAWAGYFVRDQEDILIPQCLEGAHRQGLHIPKSPGDPAWEALERRSPVIWKNGEGRIPAWLGSPGKAVAEVACFPFGEEDVQAVGVVATWQKGYFQRVGSSYFLAFAYIGDLVLRLHSQALRDPLTGLPNRQLFSDRLTHDREQSSRRERLLGVGIFDLDGFKQVNDRWGHAAGDELLRQVVARISPLLRTGDTLARLGGDEFGLLLPDISRIDDIEVICERILEELRRPFDLGNELAQISASIGFTVYPLDEGDPETLLRHADTAMYAAKNEGKDQCRSHTLAMDAETKHRAAAREKVACALRENRLLLHYQPIVRAEEGTGSPVLGVEALLRLDPGDGEPLLSPGSFGDSLDHPRLARDIGRFVLESALDQAERWHAQGLPLRVAVNISGRHLLDHRFPTDLEEALARHPGLPVDHLEIEVTETAPLQHFEQACQALEQCNRLGVRTALDDFGTGNASLTYLQRLPAQTIKIDQSFVRDIINDPRDLAIVAGVITTARMLGLEVIAEGVETRRHAELLREMHCSLLQGYWIARPMPPPEILGWVANYQPAYSGSASIPEGASEDLLIGHAHRVQQFAAALEGREAFPDHVLEVDTEQRCHLGVWMATKGQKFANRIGWPQIQQRHGTLHQLAREAKGLLDSGRREEALAVAKQMTLENAALMAELRVLMANTDVFLG
ncbi:EAL domain-containing protein, partial [Acidithiobacillus sp. MC6.1]|nr:EAL domain-containing protein [Acidithiobacillus sp. MC6.1]